jgi:GNAT superfamily N-acetyltransferase
MAASNDAEVEQLFVEEEVHGKGYGPALLRRAETFALTDTTASQLVLGVAAKYERARALYAKFGYVVTKSEPVGFRMAKPLVRSL